MFLSWIWGCFNEGNGLLTIYGGIGCRDSWEVGQKGTEDHDPDKYT